MTTQRQDNFIRTLSLRNRTLNARTLSHELRTAADVNVSDQTIRNRLHSRNLRPRRRAVHIPLTRHHRRLSLDWCRPGEYYTDATFRDHDRFGGGPFLRPIRLRPITLGPTVAALLMTLCKKTTLFG